MIQISHAKPPVAEPRARCRILRYTFLWVLLGASGCIPIADSAALTLLSSPGYESPVHADPDDLVFIAGDGFDPASRVVYAGDNAGIRLDEHPPSVPRESTASLGIAPVVQIAGAPPRSITVQLPQELAAGAVYRLWVVNSAGEWSRSVSINDPRPMWITPGYVYSTADLAGLNRRVRVVGRNLAPAEGKSLSLRLDGPRRYVLEASPPASGVKALSQYVTEATLPLNIPPGSYSVSVSRDGVSWASLPSQHLLVRPDPAVLPHFALRDSSFGSCRPDDGADDSACFANAINAASSAGGGYVDVPRGRWDLSGSYSSNGQIRGFQLGRKVHLLGSGADATSIVWHGPPKGTSNTALLTLAGENSIIGISFADEQRFASPAEARPVIQLGTRPAASLATDGSDAISDVVIADDRFLPVGEAVVDSGRPLERLLILRNEFGAYDNSLYLAHAGGIVDSVIRWNRFLPGSYTDVAAHQGAIASQLGGSSRVDFSSNMADGTSTAALQSPDDPKGFRAAFFWSLGNNGELLLVSENRISCPGDKAGDGEAIALDGNGNTSGFAAAQPVEAAGADWITVRGTLETREHGRPVSSGYYVGHWVFLMEGRGLGQTRKITSYVENARAGTVTLRVSPAWDVVPAAPSRIVVERQYWQVYLVGNQVDQGSPPCRKSNLTGPHGGQIGIWAPSADSSIEANSQIDTDGIGFLQAYSALAPPPCPGCDSSASFQTALEIRGNTIEGEYDWSSDCSKSGITGAFSASPTPASPPPILSFGVAIDHNVISHADGFRGGAIDISLTWFAGPHPEDWPMIESLMIFHNSIRDMSGPAPRAVCNYGQRSRMAIRLDGKDNIRNTILYRNRCEQPVTLLADAGKNTSRICPAQEAEEGASCECEPLR